MSKTLNRRGAIQQLALALTLPSESLAGAKLLSESCAVDNGSLKLVADVRSYGAVGDGAQDDTLAVQSALTSLDAEAKRTRKRGALASPSYTLLFPPGIYNIRSTLKPPNVDKLNVVSMFAGSSCILLPPDVDFLRLKQRMEAFRLHGMHFFGGRNILQLTYPRSNVAGRFTVSECIFEGYEETAISNCSSDHPYWSISQNMFRSAPSSTRSVGISLVGYLDGTEIVRNAFERNIIHLALGGLLSGSIRVEGNDFICIQEGALPVADIWLRGSTEEPAGQNSGTGLFISRNKFGNEFYDGARPRIVVSNKSPGDHHRLDDGIASKDERWVLNGLSITENRFSGVSEGIAPLIRAVSTELPNFRFYANHFDGGTYPSLVAVDSSKIDPGPWYSRTWLIEISSIRYPNLLFDKDVVDGGCFGILDEPLGLYPRTSMIRRERLDYLASISDDSIQEEVLNSEKRAQSGGYLLILEVSSFKGKYEVRAMDQQTESVLIQRFVFGSIMPQILRIPFIAPGPFALSDLTLSNSRSLPMKCLGIVPLTTTRT